MSETITYPAGMRKTLIDVGWRGSVNALATRRSIKMARPQCAICQSGPFPWPDKWWENCKHGPKNKGGSPYWSLRPIQEEKEAFEVAEDGSYTKVVRGKDPKEDTVIRLMEHPNVTEVLFDTMSNSGDGPKQKRDENGFKPLADVGMAPICEAYGCGNSWPTFKSYYGLYCSEAHARAVALHTEGEFIIAHTSAFADPQAIRKAQRAEKDAVDL